MCGKNATWKKCHVGKNATLTMPRGKNTTRKKCHAERMPREKVSQAEKIPRISIHVLFTRTCYVNNSVHVTCTIFHLNCFSPCYSYYIYICLIVAFFPRGIFSYVVFFPRGIFSAWHFFLRGIFSAWHFFRQSDKMPMWIKCQPDKMPMRIKCQHV